MRVLKDTIFQIIFPGQRKKSKSEVIDWGIGKG